MEFQGFQWDRGNHDKSRLKHGILPEEAEDCFFQDPLIVVDKKHTTEMETRYVALGETQAGKKLFVSFTMRSGMIRVISARSMHKKERTFYEEERKKTAL